ncbi:MAG TPA: helix-turn-helix domain-containing protein, partial [Synergistales bacterium]|nr:helix-turn-helix domain-containing protein [Synergistales bacterium]
MKNDEIDTKQHILQVARSEFAASGYYATSMDSIVKTTGLSKGAIYWHFRSKADLFKAVLSEEAEMVKEIIFPTKEDLKEKDLQQFFLERGEKLINFYLSGREHGLLWLHISLEAQRENTEVTEIAIDIKDYMTNELIEKLTDLEAGMERFYNGLDRKEFILLFESILNGLLLDLQFKRNPEMTKKFWKYLVTRLLSKE